MDSSQKRLHSYNEAIKALNGLQTNAAVLKKAQEERLKKYVNTNVQQVRDCIELSGISEEDLNGLKVIHVSGTKGKGSTCAFTESILRHHGLKTGFYSSPHLVSATERIRINGQPLSQEVFAKHFWEVYERIVRDQDDKPAYFKFLTVLAFNVFIKEKVDVAVIEVGIGGAYDSTNVVHRPVAVGITLLDYDHVKVLGNTIEEIAWHKAGIMKPGTVAFINPNQPASALQVIKERSQEIGCQLFSVPLLSSYNWSSFPPNEIGLFKEVHADNASLSLQLARFFLTRVHPIGEKGTSAIQSCKAFQLESREAIGLRLCNWPGRSQTVRRGNITFYLDGAHTEQSMWACRSWFNHLLTKNSNNSKKILIFNSTGDRSPEVLLAPLITLPFDEVIFCTNETKEEDMASDNTNLNFSFEYAIRKCASNKATWDSMQKSLIESEKQCIKSQVVSHIEDALKLTDQEAVTTKVQVFVTGSLHLVGGVLSFIHPNCFEKSPEELDYEMQIIQKYSNMSLLK